MNAHEEQFGFERLTETLRTVDSGHLFQRDMLRDTGGD
jgi:hypothetical protein